jgi:hypothetical protein
MKTAIEAREKFAPEAVEHTVSKLNRLRREIDAFEKAIQPTR